MQLKFLHAAEHASYTNTRVVLIDCKLSQSKYVNKFSLGKAAIRGLDESVKGGGAMM